MLEYKKPVPVPSDESKPYWDGLREHRLLMPKCTACGEHWFPPTQYCTHCRSKDWTWSQVSGKGKVFSFVVYHRVYHPGFAGEVPYAVAVIELAEGPRMLSNVLGVPAEELVCDTPVEIVFEDIVERVTLPKFKPLAR